MKRLILIVMVLVLATIPIMVGCGTKTATPSGSIGRNVIDFGKLTVGTTAVTMANVTWASGNTWATLRSSVKHAMVNVNFASIRYRDDGIAANSTWGNIIKGNTSIEFLDPGVNYYTSIRDFSAIHYAAPNATVYITIYD